MTKSSLGAVWRNLKFSSVFVSAAENQALKAGGVISRHE